MESFVNSLIFAVRFELKYYRNGFIFEYYRLVLILIFRLQLEIYERGFNEPKKKRYALLQSISLSISTRALLSIGFFVMVVCSQRTYYMGGESNNLYNCFIVC